MAIETTERVEHVEETFIAARVNQLDAEVLDNYVESLLFTQLKEVLTKASDIVHKIKDYEPEFELLIKLYLFKNTVYANHSSIGQDTLGLAIKDSRSLGRPNRLQLRLLAVGSLILPWLHQRFLSKIMTPAQSKTAEVVINGLNIINFVSFLVKGVYKSLPERIAKVTTGYSSLATAFNPVNYDYMNKELLWYTLAEFTSFALPLINVQKIKNTIRRHLPLQYSSDKTVQARTESDFTSCAICEEMPTMVREIGCAHVFCYYCAQSCFDADPDNGFSCPKCSYRILEASDIRPVKLKIN